MSNRKQILSEIAYMFYEEGLTQVEISKRMNLSRPTVAAMLKEAKEVGIVKITIQSDDYTLLRKQTLLCENPFKLLLIKEKSLLNRMLVSYVQILLRKEFKVSIRWVLVGEQLYMNL